MLIKLFFDAYQSFDAYQVFLDAYARKGRTSIDSFDVPTRITVAKHVPEQPNMGTLGTALQVPLPQS